MKDKRAITDEEKAEVLNELLNIWIDNSELRLTQIISNAHPWGDLDIDPYYLEDYAFVKSIKKRYGK